MPNKPKVPTNLPTLTWSYHKQSWSNCAACELYSTRCNVVLGKGKIPADVLFIGEAPGFSEDTLGRPFVGNAGYLLDDIIEEAEAGLTTPLRKAFTNLVCCIPLGEDKKKVSEPKREWIEACSTRLQEFVELCRPKAVVMLGKLSQRWVPKIVDWDFEYSVDILHPAAILRLDESQKPLAIQRAVVRLQDLFHEVSNA